ncbi:MAG: restriction endonuclease subunit S [Fimbriimonas sp.]
MSLLRYHHYKDSGTPWLGKVPSHWQVVRLKNLFQLMKRDPVADDEIVTAFRDGQVTLRSNRRTEGFTNALHEHGYQRIFPGELVIHAMDAFAGAIGVSDSVGKSTPVYSVCRPKSDEVNPWFYGLLLRHMALSGFVTALAKGVRERSTEFRWSEASEVRVPLPPKQEQNEIVAFLGRETAKLDSLLTEQRRLAELLKEKRQAVISQVISRGLTSTALKNSGIEWLGDIPKHWRLERGRRLYTKLEMPPQEGDEVVTAFRDGQVTLRLNRRTEGFTFAVLEVGYQHVRQGDLVIHGMDAFAGAIGVSESTGKCSPEYAVLSPLREDLVNEYFAKVLRLMAQRNYIYVICPSVRERAPRFRYEAFKDVQLPVPPRAEQELILDEIGHQTSRIDELLATSQAAIALLQERKSALISATVTGQIKVQEASMVNV